MARKKGKCGLLAQSRKPSRPASERAQELQDMFILLFRISEKSSPSPPPSWPWFLPPLLVLLILATIDCICVPHVRRSDGQYHFWPNQWNMHEMQQQNQQTTITVVGICICWWNTVILKVNAMAKSRAEEKAEAEVKGKRPRTY